MTVTCDESHIYRMDGVIVPGVTEIINAVLPRFQASEWHKNRGTATHKGIELLEKDKLNWATVHPAIIGRLKAWQKFRKDFPAEMLANEVMLGHTLYRFAGKLDAPMRQEKKIIIADAKSMTDFQGVLQLGGYSLLWRTNNGNCITDAGVLVVLRDNESYQCKWLDKAGLRRAENEFLALLTVFNAARREKISLPGDRNETMHSNSA